MLYTEFVTSRRTERIVVTSLSWALVLPVLGKRLPVGLPWSWYPGGPRQCLLMGCAGGLAEDIHVRLAYAETMRDGAAIETELWTMRSLVPAVLFLLSPLLGLKCLDGEIQGTSIALAQLEGRPFREWPFFAVLPLDISSTYRDCPRGWTPELHLLRCRYFDGFYDIPRNPKNNPWRVF